MLGPLFEHNYFYFINPSFPSNMTRFRIYMPRKNEWECRLCYFHVWAEDWILYASRETLSVPCGEPQNYMCALANSEYCMCM